MSVWALRGGSIAEREDRRFARQFLAACLLTLLLAQIIAGLLTLAFLRRSYADLALVKVEAVAFASQSKLENALRFGKSLTQFLGLAEMLREAGEGVPEVGRIAVFLADGALAAATVDKFEPTPGQRALFGDRLESRAGLVLRPSGASVFSEGRLRSLAVPIKGAGRTQGFLVVEVSSPALDAALAPVIDAMLRNLALTTALAIAGTALGLTCLFMFLANGRHARTLIFIVPVAGIVLAQATFAFQAMQMLRPAYVSATLETAQFLGRDIKRGAEGLLKRGVDLGRLSGLTPNLARVVATLPEIGRIVLTSSEGVILAEAHAPAFPPGSIAPDLSVSLPFVDSQGAETGEIKITLDQAVIWREIRRRFLDAATITGISVVLMAELFLLLAAIFPGMETSDTMRKQRMAQLGRPLIAAFVFAWALPLPILALYGQDLPLALIEVPDSIRAALPISAEMLAALVTALIAGAMTDRRGWHVPVAFGLIFCLAGGFVSSFAGSAEFFILGRLVVGAGYGFAWIGIQALVIQNSDSGRRAQNMAHLVAGIYAGHLAGTSIGALVADQFGYETVFLASALLLCLPILGTVLLLRFAREDDAQAALARDAGGMGRALRLLGNRDFGAMLYGSVVPFSIVQVGLLYFALPIQLKQLGSATADIGRIIMVYGLLMIFVAPSIARLVERWHGSRVFVPLAGLIAAIGFSMVVFEGGQVGLLVAVIAVALAGAFTQAVQSSYALSLREVQNSGLGIAFSVQRAADKFGQMLGPVVIGALMSSFGVTQGLAIVGFGFAGLTLAFFLISRAARPQSAAHNPASGSDVRMDVLAAVSSQPASERNLVGDERPSRLSRVEPLVAVPIVATERPPVPSTNPPLKDQPMRLTLAVISDQRARLGALAQFQFDERGGTIGRSSTCDWAIPDPSNTLSGRHALIGHNGRGFLITDTSTNGVYVNRTDMPLGRGNSAPLLVGDTIYLAQFVLSVAISADARPAAAPIGQAPAASSAAIAMSQVPSTQTPTFDPSRIVDRSLPSAIPSMQEANTTIVAPQNAGGSGIPADFDILAGLGAPAAAVPQARPAISRDLPPPSATSSPVDAYSLGAAPFVPAPEATDRMGTVLGGIQVASPPARESVQTFPAVESPAPIAPPPSPTPTFPPSPLDLLRQRASSGAPASPNTVAPATRPLVAPTAAAPPERVGVPGPSAAPAPVIPEGIDLLATTPPQPAVSKIDPALDALFGGIGARSSSVPNLESLHALGALLRQSVEALAMLAAHSSSPALPLAWRDPQQVQRLLESTIANEAAMAATAESIATVTRVLLEQLRNETASQGAVGTRAPAAPPIVPAEWGGLGR